MDTKFSMMERQQRLPGDLVPPSALWSIQHPIASTDMRLRASGGQNVGNHLFNEN